MNHSDIEHMAQGFPPSSIGKDHEEVVTVLATSLLATQQKLDVAIKRGDACMQAEMAWEKAMMAAIGEDGVGCVVKAIAALKAERDALAAENAALNEVISAVRGVADNSEGIAGWHLNCDVAGWDEILPEIDDIETPATDAALNTFRAEGVIMFASKQLAAISDLESTITFERLMLDAEEFAGQLRGSKDGE